jgi:hypothetical protein
MVIVAVRDSDLRTFEATLDIDGVFFDADSFGNTPEQALGGFSFFIASSRCNFQWWATAVAPDHDRDGWSTAAEQRLGSDPDDHLSTPEHWEVSTTDFYGPDSCHDFADNDRNELIDADDPNCVQ